MFGQISSCGHIVSNDIITYVEIMLNKVGNRNTLESNQKQPCSRPGLSVGLTVGCKTCNHPEGLKAALLPFNEDPAIAARSDSHLAKVEVNVAVYLWIDCNYNRNLFALHLFSPWPTEVAQWNSWPCSSPLRLVLSSGSMYRLAWFQERFSRVFNQYPLDGFWGWCHASFHVQVICWDLWYSGVIRSFGTFLCISAANWTKLSHASAIESRVGAVEGAIGNGSLMFREHLTILLKYLWTYGAKKWQITMFEHCHTEGSLLGEAWLLDAFGMKKYRWIPGNNAVIYGSADGQQSV